MGKNNRQRRAEARREQSRGRSGHDDMADRLGLREIAEMLVFGAAEAAELGQAEELERLVDDLVYLGEPAGTAMTAALVRALRTAWESGWEPADVDRAARKRLSPAAAALATEMIKYEAHVSGRAAGEPLADHEPWSDEGAFTAGAGLLGMLLHLPVMPKVQPTAAKAGANANGVDTRLLDKVRALLAKAESTEFPEEAESLTAKAQELMARYAIDHAMLGRASAGAGGSGSDTPGGRRLAVDDPYAHGKALLLAAIATANRCCTVWSDAYGFATVVGFGSDIDIVELLYVSLLVQATRAMTAAGAVRDSAGRSRTRSFRQSFLISFAGRIGERLAAATRVATEEAGGVHGSSLLPVLASRVAEVEQARTEMFPHLRSTSARATNHAGWAAGRAAADRANLGPEGELPADVAV